MEKSLTLLCLFLLSINTLHAQSPPAIEWQTSLGGSLIDNVDFGGSLSHSMVPTADGGLILIGHSFSNDGDVTGHHGLPATADFWVVKLDDSGNLEWQRSLGGSENDYGTGISQTSDGGYILIGNSYSNDGDVSGHNGTTDTVDVWVAKLDSLGNLSWQQSFGGTSFDQAANIVETNDGGFVFFADTRSVNGNISFSHGEIDAWMVKLDNSGTLLWEKTFGGSLSEKARALRKTPDGGYIAFCQTTSVDGDITYNAHPGFGVFSELWVFKTDSLGNLEWDKCFGGSSLEFARDILATQDGGYILICLTTSTDDDISCNHGSFDAWVAKLDSIGNLEWSGCYGGAGTEKGASVWQTPDGGFVFASTTDSASGDVSSVIGSKDCWIIKTDGLGNIEWEKTYGGTGPEGITSVVQMLDGSIAFSGESGSNDVDVSGHHGALNENDIWVVKLNPVTTGVLSSDLPTGFLKVSPNPFSSSTTVSFRLNSPEEVSIALYDMTGRMAYKMEETNYNSGEHQFLLTASGTNGALENGIYVIQLTTSNQQFSKKIIINN